MEYIRLFFNQLYLKNDTYLQLMCKNYLLNFIHLYRYTLVIAITLTQMYIPKDSQQVGKLNLEY